MDTPILDRLAALPTDAEWQQMVDARKGRPVPVPEPPPPPTTPSLLKLATGVNHEYSTMYPGNVDHRAILLQHPGGWYGLHYANGSLFKMLPAQVNHSSQPRWSRKKPTCFYYLYLNELRMYDVANDSIVTVRKFDMPNINGMGESDISEDDNHLVLCSGQRVFVYEISSDKTIVDFVAPDTFNNLYIDPQNRPIIGFNSARAMQIYDGGALRKVAGAIGHMDVSSDKTGNPIMVWANGKDDTGLAKNAELAGCRNGIELRQLNGATAPRCLLSLDWSLACHISLPDRATFAIVSTHNPQDPNSPIKYANELLKLYLDSQDGSHVESLGKHGSKADVYARQPKASVSPDGSRFIYDRNGDVWMETL